MWTGFRNRLQFLILSADAAGEELGRATQLNRLVGWLFISGIIFTGLVAGLATLAAILFDLALPRWTVPLVVFSLLLLEGAYLEWSKTIAFGGATINSGAATMHVHGETVVINYFGSQPADTTPASEPPQIET